MVKRQFPSQLPIDKHIQAIRTALEQHRCAVVQAAPGAGKTTRVPIALLDAAFLSGKKILLLEPRRLAAVSCARYMASQLGEKVGQTVGYRIRLETKVSRKTRIEIITEGVFTRMIQGDPGLEDIGLVIFDEFHERNIHSDTGLAFCLDTFEALNENLRILVMSATMDTAAVSQLMGHAPVIDSKGKSFPVKTVYLPSLKSSQEQLAGKRWKHREDQCMAAVGKALENDAKGILVFLPGISEIKSLMTRLKPYEDKTLEVVSLYGHLTPEEQAKAILPPAKGKQKIVVSTAIAETSITIDGIDTVIDAGLMRMPEFSWKSGMTRLVTVPVSKAAADQRRGRAGRTAPGICYRLWSEYEHTLLKPHTPPEILNADLTGLLLELAMWGVKNFEDLKWLDIPGQAMVENAKTLLQTLEALDKEGNITDHGRKMAASGLHPRLSHMILKAEPLGSGTLACRLAAFLSERDFIRFEPGMADPDIGLRLAWIEALEKKTTAWKGSFSVNKGVVRRILASEKKIARDFGIAWPGNGTSGNGSAAGMDMDSGGRVLAFAFPDRIAQKRQAGKLAFLTASGKGVVFSFPCILASSEYILAIHLDGNPKNAKIFLAAAYDKSDLEADFSEQIHSRISTDLEDATGVIQTVEQKEFGQLVMDLVPKEAPDSEVALELMLAYIRKNGIKFLPWNKELRHFRERVMFLKQSGAPLTLPDVSEAELMNTLDSWLGPFLYGITSVKQLAQLDLSAAFYALFSWEAKKKVEQLAPTHMIVPSGSKRPLIYGENGKIFDAPQLFVRLQEMFGLKQTPCVAGGSVAVTLVLLSPASRPVQITQDLESFWKNAYPEVKKDLAGRYPKHYWPDDPLRAKPTSRTKKKML